MTREEEIYNAEFASNPYFMSTDGPQVVGAHQLGFKHGVEWADTHRWHKVADGDLPKEKHYKERTLQGIREWSESESVLVIDNHYLKTVDSLKNGEWMKLRTHPKDCDGFPIQYLYWMSIPEPPKED